MISNSVFDPLRSLVAITSPDLAQIQRNTPVSDGHGGFTDTFANLGSAVACRVAPLGQQAPREGVVADRLAGETPWELTLPVGTDVVASDRIVVNGTTTYEVVGLTTPRSYAVRIRVTAKIIPA